MNKTKILLLVHELSLTGAPRSILEIFEEMGEVEVRTISLDSGPFIDRYKKLGKLLVLPKLPLWGSLWNRILRQIKLGFWRMASSWILLGWEPDLIYVNSVAALPVAKLIKLPRVPALLHVRELETEIEKHVGNDLKLLQIWPDKIVAVSEFVKKVLIEKFKVEPQKIEVVKSFIPEQRLEALKNVEAITLQTKPFTVGGAGTISWRKGYVLWLLMAVELKNILGPGKVRFSWVGINNSIMSREFRWRAHKLGLENDVDFVRFTSDPFAIFNQFDVFASTSWEEPSGNAVLENMVLKKPVVCFEGSGGTPEFVGDTGVIVKDFSPKAMADEIAILARSNGRIKELGRRAQKRIFDNFTSTAGFPKLKRIIFNLTQTGAA